MVGLPGDASNALAKGSKVVSDYVEDKLGIDKGPELHRPVLPTTEKIDQFIGGDEKRRNAVGKFLDRPPETTGGKYFESIGEFAPAVVGGPGGIGRKAIQSIAGGIGAEGGGSLAEYYFGDQAGPIGRLIGGALGLGGAPKLAKDTVPTAEALAKEANQAYKEARALPLELDRTGMDSLHKSIETELKLEGYRDLPNNAPGTFGAIKELIEPAGKNATITDIDSVRKVLNNVSGSKSDMKAATLAKERIDEYLSNIPDHHVISGDPSAVAEIFQRARPNYAALKRSETISKAMEKAERQAASSGSGANIDNAIRQRLKEILNNDKKRRGFSKDEIAQMERVVRGGPIGNIARKIGKFAPTGVVSAMPTIAAKLAAGDLAAVGLGGMGYAAKNLSEHLTKKGVANLDKMIGIGSVPTPEHATIDAIVRAALAERNRRAGQSDGEEPYRGPNLDPLQPSQ
jgi:hypothetical protein